MIRIGANIRAFLSFISLLISVCVGAMAQSSAPPAAPSSSATPSGSVIFSGSIRERYEVWHWFPANGEDFYGFSGTLMRFALSEKRRDYDWTIEMAVPILLGLPDK